MSYEAIKDAPVGWESPRLEEDAARSYGYEAAGALPDIYTRIARATGPLPPRLATTWWDNVHHSFGGDPVLRGRGVLVQGSLGDLADRLRACALEFRAKGAARIFVHGVTLWGGSGDAEARRVDWIWADSDSKYGYGDWLDLQRALDWCGIAYVASRSGGHSPEKPKWHIHFPIAQPLYPPAAPPHADPSATSGPAKDAWTAHEAAINVWKAAHRDQCLWFFGVLARIAGLIVKGFDEKIANRIFQPSYPASRRHEHAAVAEVVCREGRALDWHALLAATGYTPTPNAVRHKPLSISVDPETATAWHNALAHDGYIIEAMAGGRYAVRCPWEHLHSPGGTKSGTVMFASGKFHCSHGHWTKHNNNTDLLAVLSPEARAYVDTASESEGVRALRERLREHNASQGERVSLQELAVRIDQIAKAHKPGTTDVIIAPPGAGKNRALNAYVPYHATGAVVVAPNHELAGQHAFDIRGNTIAEVEHRRGVLSCVNDEGVPLCTQYDRASKIQAAGADVSSVVCSSCPDRHGCPAKKAVAENRGANIIVTVPQLADKARASIARQNGIRPEDVLTVFDESVKFFEAASVHQTELAQSLAVLDDDAGRDPTDQLFDSDRLELAREGARILVQQRGGAFSIQAACDLAPCTLPMLPRMNRPPLPEALHRICSQYVRDPIRFDAGLAKDSNLVWEVNVDALAIVLRTVLVLGELALTIDREGVDCIEWFDGALRVRVMTDAARDLESFGGIVTDATPKEHELLVLTRGMAKTFHRFDVPDGAPITREAVYRKATSRGVLLQAGAWPEVLALFRDAISRAKNAGCKQVLFVTYKKLVEPIRAAVDQGAIAVRQLLDNAGFGYDLAWYGAIRGLNKWLAFDGCVTIGDAWENIVVEAADIRAACRRAGVEPTAAETEALIRLTAESELLQAHNRLRDPSRKLPAWHWHFGNVVPAGWHEGNATVSGALLRGRPKTEIGMTQDEVRRWVDAVGGNEAAARQLEVTERQIRRYLDGSQILEKKRLSF